MRVEPIEDTACAFEDLLNDGSKNENDLQRFLEEHSEFLVTPWLLNHQLHMNCVITKFPVGDRTADFAYLTKSSDKWCLVLVEIERADKCLFNRSSKHVGMSAVFNEALAQTSVWREYWDENKNTVRERLRPLLVPLGMARNKLELRRVLVIGRSQEKDSNEDRRQRIAAIEKDQQIEILTFDTLLRHYRNGRGEKRCILSPRSSGYSIKHMDGQPEHLFAYVYPEHLDVPPIFETQLKAAGFQMDAWRNNELLIYNGKWSTTPSDEEAGGVHPGVKKIIAAAKAHKT
ncbi:Shedu anti-phage system protein SduA domain-containing protein [Parasphingorhabdus sp.]|uniref:Shedu anti-phage system protein SduA domain-containing protein n=1 Tax=Parasphingorhabdus sp. TaxID=2709688 RepID=UPI003BB1B087